MPVFILTNYVLITNIHTCMILSYTVFMMETLFSFCCQGFILHPPYLNNYYFFQMDVIDENENLDIGEEELQQRARLQSLHGRRRSSLGFVLH